VCHLCNDYVQLHLPPAGVRLSPKLSRQAVLTVECWASVPFNSTNLAAKVKDTTWLCNAPVLIANFSVVYIKTSPLLPAARCTTTQVAVGLSVRCCQTV
jgi:hypothetical protein